MTPRPEHEEITAEPLKLDRTQAGPPRASGGPASPEKGVFLGVVIPCRTPPWMVLVRFSSIKHEPYADFDGWLKKISFLRLVLRVLVPSSVSPQFR